MINVVGLGSIGPSGRYSTWPLYLLDLLAVCTIQVHAEEAADHEFVLTGILCIGANKHAAIEAVGDPAGEGWKREGDAVGAYFISAIKDDAVTLRKPHGEGSAGPEEIVVRLKQPSTPPFEKVDPDALTPEQVRWFRSPDNPLVKGMHIPDGLIENWRSLTREEKLRIFRWYLSNGVRMIVVVEPHGITFHREPLLSRHFRKYQRKHLRVFEESLSDEQRALDARIAQLSVAALGDPPVEPIEPGEVEKLKAAFDASLTPEQAELRRRILEAPEELKAAEATTAGGR